MPKGVEPLTASDYSRYLLSNPSIDVCMMRVKNIDQMPAYGEAGEKTLLC